MDEAFVSWDRFDGPCLTPFDEVEQAVAWGSFDGLDWLELGDRVFPFLVNENDNKRWNREQLLGQGQWLEFSNA